MDDLISRQDAIDAIKGLPTWWADGGGYYGGAKPPMEALLEPNDVISAIDNLPSAQPERYTKEELRVFQHGISLSLLSKRSAQHWQYDEDTATEIKFLERLYDKVSADTQQAESEGEK